MRCIISGGAGFMGSWVAHALCDLGHDVLVLDDLSGGSTDNIPEAADASFFDLRDHKKTEEVFRIFNGDVLYHLACHPHEGLSVFQPVDIATSVLTASLSVFKAAINTGVRRIVNFSSMARYGKAGGKMPPFDETSPAIPADPYGAAKYAAERSLVALAEAHDLEYCTLVPHNVIGPRQHFDPYRNVVAIFANRIMQGKPPLIYGDGKQRRALSDIRDSLPCYLKAGLEDGSGCVLEGARVCKGHLGETINIGGLEHHSINEIAQMTVEAFGSDLEPLHVEARPCEVKLAYCSIHKSEVLLGFEQKRTVRETIQDFVDWAKTQGPQEFKYLDRDAVEISRNLPPVWRDQKL